MIEFKEWIYVQHRYFNVGKMLIVKRLQNPAWWGLRYLADNNVLVYSEYHENELELYQEPVNELLKTIDI